MIVGVPGAFTGACTNTHVPGYVKHLPKFADKGVGSIYVITVNDPFVTKAWSDKVIPEGTSGIEVLADTDGSFTKELGLLFDASKILGNSRSTRYALLVEDGKIKEAFVEPDKTSVNVSASEEVIKQL